jgi:uncharacterized membrane protein YdbT with pleckstrin-like domain
MDYKEVWQKVLSNGENVRYEFSIGNAYRKCALILSGFSSVFILLITFAWHILWIGIAAVILLFFYYGFYIKKANAYAFCDKRLIIHKGWLSTSAISVDYNKITDVTVRQGFFEKLMSKSGSIIINTAGTSKYEVVLRNIEQPYEVKKKLDELRG